MTGREKILEKLDNFLATKTIVDIDRNRYCVFAERDWDYKITVAIVFDKLITTVDGDYNIVINNEGVVINVQAYWLSIPKELAMPYLTSLIDEFYKGYVDGWGNSNDPVSDPNGTANPPCYVPNNGTGCNPNPYPGICI